MEPTPKKIRVAVLYGGKSAEHEVSVQSAKNVIQHLDKNLFEVIPIGIDHSGRWYDGCEIFQHSLQHRAVPKLGDNDAALCFNPNWLTFQPSLLSTSKSTSSRHFDVIFPVVHGTFCEDGTLQGLLEQLNVPYVGAGVLASAVGMDKDVAKRLVMQEGVPVHPYVHLKKGRWSTSAAACLKEINCTLTYPLFVKPANAGSSIGVRKVKCADELQDAIDHAFLFDTKILIEQGLRAMELEVAVLESLKDGEVPIVSVIGQIKPTEKHEFYSYDAKYLDDDGALLIIPAPLTDQQITSVKQYAIRIFTALEVEGMARIDLFLDLDHDHIYFNEINTLPGFTEISMYPKLMQASGMAYSHLLTHLIQLAIKRAEARTQLICTYNDESTVVPL